MNRLQQAMDKVALDDLELKQEWMKSLLLVVTACDGWRRINDDDAFAEVVASIESFRQADRDCIKAGTPLDDLQLTPFVQRLVAVLRHLFDGLNSNQFATVASGFSGLAKVVFSQW
jgi:hypothetical protein